MKIPFYLLVIATVLSSCQSTSQKKEIYSSSRNPSIYVADFENKAKRVPDDFFVMEGNWDLRKLGDSHSLHLAPFPLKTKSVLFGPDSKKGLDLSADVYGSQKGRLFPNYSIGTHGLSGFRMNVKPGVRGSALELYYNESQLIARSFITWKTDTWFSLRIQVKELTDGTVQVLGKFWERGTKEPTWQLTYKGKATLDEGQCSVWGFPYSGRDMFFDNLVISKP